MIRASVIIASHNCERFLAASLASLKREIQSSPHGEGVEVIVVDDGSSDNTVDVVRAHYPAVYVIVNQTPSGPSHARNRGAERARGDLLLFLDADGEVDRGWLDAMLVAGEHADVVLGNVVDFHGGRPQSVPRRATFLGKSLRCTAERANTGPSCNLGIARAAFETLGGFDEELPYYFEDSDLCIRAKCAGYRSRFVPDAIFRHHGTEKKSGEAVRMQEHNSTYAMLKLYGESPLKLVVFSLLNAYWMALRFLVWTACGRVTDAFRLFRGWASAHSRFVNRQQ